MIVLKISPVILWLLFLEKVLCDNLSDIRVPSSFGFRTSRRQRQGFNHSPSVENQEKISIAVNEGKLKDEKTLEIKAYQFNHPPSTDNEEIISVTIGNQSNDDKSLIVNANEQRKITEQSQIHPSEIILESNDKRQIIKNYRSENKTLDDSRKRNSRTRGNRQRSRVVEKETAQKIDESVNIQGSEKVVETGKKIRQNEEKIPVAFVYEDINTNKESFLEVKSYKFNHPPSAEKDEIIPVAINNDKENIKYEKSEDIKTKPNPNIYKENAQRKVIEQRKSNPKKENLETKIKAEELISEIKQAIDNKNQLTATYKSEDKSLEQLKTTNSRTRGNRQRNQIIENNAAAKNYESKSKNSEDKENGIKTDIKSLSEMIIPVKVVYEKQTAQISRNQNRRIYSDRPRGFQLLKIDEKPIDISKNLQSISNDEKNTITTYHPPASITTTPNGLSDITRTNSVTPSVNINEQEIKANPYPSLKPENKNVSNNNKSSDMTSNVEANSSVKLSTETKLSSVQSITNINQSEIQHTQPLKDKLNLEVTTSAVTNSPMKHTTENKLTLVNSEKIANELESKEARDSKIKLNSGLPQETDAVNISKMSTGKRRRERDPIVPIIESTNNVYSQSGSFKYSYESGDGTKAFSQGELKTFDEDKAGEAVVGGFSYKDKDGKDFSLTYTADENGYRPVGDHLPTPPPIPVAIARALRYLATKTTPEPVTEAVKSESSAFKIDTQSGNSSLVVTNTQVINTTLANLELTTRSVKPINIEPELKQKAEI